VAILSSVNESNLEESLTAFRRIRAARALASLQSGSVASAIDKMSLSEINKEIAAVRKKRKQ